MDIFLGSSDKLLAYDFLDLNNFFGSFVTVIFGKLCDYLFFYDIFFCKNRVSSRLFIVDILLGKHGLYSIFFVDILLGN